MISIIACFVHLFEQAPIQRFAHLFKQASSGQCPKE